MFGPFALLFDDRDDTAVLRRRLLEMDDSAEEEQQDVEDCRPRIVIPHKLRP